MCARAQAHSYLVIIPEPVPDEKIKLGFWFREGDKYDIAVVNTNRPISSSHLLHKDGREIGVSPNLIFGLENISPVCASLNGAIGSRYSILP